MNLLASMTQSERSFFATVVYNNFFYIGGIYIRTLVAEVVTFERMFLLRMG